MIIYFYAAIITTFIGIAKIMMMTIISNLKAIVNGQILATPACLPLSQHCPSALGTSLTVGDVLYIATFLLVSELVSQR